MSCQSCDAEQTCSQSYPASKNSSKNVQMVDLFWGPWQEAQYLILKFRSVPPRFNDLPLPQMFAYYDENGPLKSSWY